jgi:hypothetical protein
MSSQRICPEQIEEWARTVVHHVNRMQDVGHLPKAIGDFSALHQYFDANVGWPEPIDRQPNEVWAAIQRRASQLLSMEVN